mgnify:CR=1 FL=1
MKIRYIIIHEVSRVEPLNMVSIVVIVAAYKSIKSKEMGSEYYGNSNIQF